MFTPTFTVLNYDNNLSTFRSTYVHVRVRPRGVPNPKHRSLYFPPISTPRYSHSVSFHRSYLIFCSRNSRFRFVRSGQRSSLTLKHYDRKNPHSATPSNLFPQGEVWISYAVIIKDSCILFRSAESHSWHARHRFTPSKVTYNIRFLKFRLF